MRCGLLGRKLGHSYSPRIHSILGSYPYVLFEKEPQELESFLKNGDFTGINVTVPYKKSVIPYLDELSPIAARLGAVNTVVRRGDKLIGHNTDYFGFLTLVRDSGLNVRDKKVLVLGTGGASNTAVAVLEELEARVVIISRSGENNYGNLERHADAAVIVNTTPVGMYPETQCAPLSLDGFPHLEGVLDVIYNPANTRLLLDAKRRGLVTGNGLLMLVAQAKEASQWFTGTPLDDAWIPKIHRILRWEMENIILIGMPGCGKSTLGRLLAGKTGKTFADADEKIVALAGKPIADIFAQDGEAVFRDWENQALEELGKQSGLVLATGGGCVTQERNYPLLHQNGTVFWLQRDLHTLPTHGRPLSAGGRLEEMYRLRQPMYQLFAHYIVDNNGSPEHTLQQLADCLPGYPTEEAQL